MSQRPASRRRPPAVVGTVIGLCAAWLFVGVPASAEAESAAPESERPEDSRAELREGDAGTCEVFGGGLLVGVTADEVVTNLPDLLYEGGVPGTDRYVGITEVPEGITVTAVVVQGGPRHNVYLPGRHGLAPTAPWGKLRAPRDDGGELAPIGRWFACGEETPPESVEPELKGSAESDSAEPTETERLAESAAPTSSMSARTADGSRPPSAAVDPSSRDAADRVAAEEDDDLASTGFGGGWLIAVGAALLVGGAALLALTRLRRR